MRLIIIIFFLITSCVSAKKVYICGDRECIDKKEAEEYFATNLSIEIKIIEKKKKYKADLIDLNLNSENNKITEITNKKKLKILTNDELKIEKKILKSKRKEKKRELNKNTKLFKKNKVNKSKNDNLIKQNQKKENLVTKIFTNKKTNSLKEDSKMISRTYKINKNEICNIVKKCNIDEISAYLIKSGKNKKYPDITK